MIIPKVWEYLYCYSVSQNQMPAILGTAKNHKFTKWQAEISNWSSCLSGGSKNVWHFVEQWHYHILWQLCYDLKSLSGL